MATVIWKGDAQPIAQVTTCTVGGTIEADDIFKITIGSKTLIVAAGSTSAGTVAATIVAAFNALSSSLYPEFSGAIVAAVTSGGSFTLTARTAGVPFTVALNTTEAGGGAADDQTFTQSATTAANGGAFWNTPTNWSSGAVPIDGDDIVFENSANPVLYDLDQSSIQPASLTIKQSFTGTIGLPRVNAAGYSEYREGYLKIGPATVTIGEGEGAGSGRIKLNFGTDQVAVRVLNSGTPAENGLKSIMLRGTHASNSLIVNKGSVAVAEFAGEAATLATVKIGFRDNVTSDADVRLGSGVTLSSCTITKTGGLLEINSNLSVLNQYGGGPTVQNAGTLGTGLILAGKYIDKSSGTKTTMSARDGGEIDCGQDVQAKTYTNTNIGKSGVLRDPAKTITFTGAIALTCALDECTLDLGKTFNLQRS